MTEQGTQIDFKSLPLEERTERFQRLVQAIGLGVGGDEEYDIRALGRKIGEYHSTQESDQKQKIHDQISRIYDRLGANTNPNVGEAVASVVLVEFDFF
jgi:hypothetical protein